MAKHLRTGYLSVTDPVLYWDIEDLAADERMRRTAKFERHARAGRHHRPRNEWHKPSPVEERIIRKAALAKHPAGRRTKR